MLLGVWLEKWLLLYVDPSSLAENTKACYRRSVAAVPPPIAALEMATMTALDLMPWLIDVAKTTPRAAQLDRVMLSKALKTASKLSLCPRCILDQDTLPKPPHAPKRATVLHFDDARVYLQCAKQSSCYPLLAFCLCGLRRGEALGTRWEDLHNGCLTVVRQRMRCRHEYIAADLKTEHSRRMLRLPGWLVADLQSWPVSLSGWICDTTPERLRLEHQRTLARAKLPAVTLHGLRHPYVNPKTTLLSEKNCTNAPIFTAMHISPYTKKDDSAA